MAILVAVGVFGRQRWTHVGATGIRLALAAAALALAACNLTSTGNPNAPPDAIDRIRAADLQPRFPDETGTGNSGPQNGQRAAVYYGTTDQPAALGQGQSQAQSQAQATSDGEGFELNFENTPVTTVAKVILGDILQLGYTIDPRVQGTITLSSGRPVPKKDVLFVLENALRTGNSVMVRDTGGYRIIPAADGIGSGGVDRAAAGTSPEPGYGTTVIPLRFASVQTISKLLDSFATKPGSIRAEASRNLLLVQGSGAERRSVVDIVLNFDADWMQGQSVGIFPVHNTTPEPVITELTKIMDSGENGLSQNLVKFQAIARLNAVLVVAKQPQLLRTAGTWIGRLDSSETAGTGVKVYRVRYGDARLLARLLTQMYIGGSSGSLESATNQIAPGGGLNVSSSDTGTSMSVPDRLTGGGQQPLGGAGAGTGPRTPAVDTQANVGTGLSSLDNTGRGGGEGGPLLPGVRITADAANNSLLIYANQESYRIIERTLNQLDRPQLQVAFDATIAEVTLNDNLNYGVQFFLQSRDVGLPADVGSVINTAAAQPLAQTLPGFNFLIGNAATPRVILNALHAYTDVKILSNPSLVVVNNGTATLQVGDQVPIATGTATVLSANNAVVNTINYQNTGIILHVVPRINANGTIVLEVEQEISEVSPNSTTGTLTPTISQRKVKSTLSVANGQTVLLAGLINETQNLTRSGIPLLDQIPVVGNIFTTQNLKGIQRTELIIFIRPQIIRDSVDASVVAEELRAKLRTPKVGSVKPPGAVSPYNPEVVR